MENTLSKTRKDDLDSKADERAIMFLHQLTKRGGIILAEPGELLSLENMALSADEISYFINRIKSNFDRRTQRTNEANRGKKKQNPKAKEISDLAHEKFMNGSQKKYDPADCKRNIARQIARDIFPSEDDPDRKIKSVLRYWKDHYPDDFAK